jgi:hypothetical protein
MGKLALSAPAVIDMINGRSRSQILSSGGEFGVFAHLLDHGVQSAESIAHEIGADLALLYWLFRARSSTNLLREDGDGRFSTTERGR